MRKIGGFFALHECADKPAQSLLELWRINEHTHWMFANGRSALHHLLQHLKPKTFWLPAYCCTSLAEAADGSIWRFYPLNENLSPDCAYLKMHIEPGDAVLAIDYFGCNPDAAFLAFCKSRPDIHWIEDRAQALFPSSNPWGDYVLYTPRKLLGVTDGGIMVGITKDLPAIAYDKASDPDATHPAMQRKADTQELYNDRWYPAYVATESAIKVSQQAMSDTSKSILGHADATSIMAQRKANYAALMESLENIALLPKNNTGFVPFGFPIRIQNRRQLAALLHKNEVFAAHHWPELPSSASDFPAEHSLSQQMLTLPCDQRYGIADMERIAKLVSSAL